MARAKSTRRTFLKATGAIALAGAGRRVLGANDRVVFGLIGCGGRGCGVARSLAGHKDATAAYVCDADKTRLARGKKSLGADNAVTDLRRILDDKSVDAVVIATPDHWHAPAAILACRAGMHVYVEKPCSHNIREGRVMIDTARKHKRVVQVGTQSRSCPQIAQAVKMLRDAVIGEVMIAKAINSQRRRNIGRGKPSKPPAHLDYDMWVGPAEFVPYQSNRLHYAWHWYYNFGTGDIGNDGVHELDYALWGLGVTGHPCAVGGYGAKMFFDDDQEFADTYYITYKFPTAGPAAKKGDRPRMLVFEQRDWSPYHQDGHENCVVFYGTKGMMVLSKTGRCDIFGERNKPIKQMKFSLSTDAHTRNFLDAIKTGGKPSADIAIGHAAATVAHLGNIVARVGRTVKFDPKTERITGDAEADALVARKYRPDHWAAVQGA